MKHFLYIFLLIFLLQSCQADEVDNTGDADLQETTEADLNKEEAGTEAGVIKVRKSAAALGKKVFEQNCTACHEMNRDLVGPAVCGSKKRWNNDSTLAAFILNSQAVIESGHPYAKALFRKYNYTIMPPQAITDKEMAALFHYFDSCE